MKNNQTLMVGCLATAVITSTFWWVVAQSKVASGFSSNPQKLEIKCP